MKPFVLNSFVVFLGHGFHGDLQDAEELFEKAGKEPVGGAYRLGLVEEPRLRRVGVPLEQILRFLAAAGPARRELPRGRHGLPGTAGGPARRV